MVHAVGAVLVFLAFLAATWACLEAGHRTGQKVFARGPEARPAGLGTVETVAFALLGLLLAFTFSGAADRLDRRRAQIVDEANAIGTAWLRLDLLPEEAQPKIRDEFRRYVDARLATYRKVGEAGFASARAEYERSLALQNAIWSDSVAALKNAPSQSTIVLLPSLNAMIDITTTRLAATDTHPPKVVYVVLTVIALLCSFLAGYEMGASRARSWVHVLGLAAILSFTLYVILDFEYPRLGLIRIDDFDKYLAAVRASMN